MYAIFFLYYHDYISFFYHHQPLIKLVLSGILVRYMIHLSKQYSREKTLMHFCMWEESERLGAQLYAGQEVSHLVFIKPSAEAKVGIWNTEENGRERLALLIQKFTEDPSLWSHLQSILDVEWDFLLPYLDRLRPIQTADDLQDYLTRLTRWWTAMSMTYFVPDVPGLPARVCEEALSYRARTETYAEICDDIVVDFWKRCMPSSSQDLVDVATVEEAVALFHGTLSNSAADAIRRRLHGYGILNGVVADLATFSLMLQASNIVLKEEVIAEDIQEVRGRIANTGAVRGIARIVIKKADIRNVREGDIIIAEMTNPDYVPWMKIAAAFVTDEGGMTCHAAIVSREMGKPCVVGTKISTKIFRDGDLLEVDGTKGVVRRVSP